MGGELLAITDALLNCCCLQRHLQGTKDDRVKLKRLPKALIACQMILGPCHYMATSIEQEVSAKLTNGFKHLNQPEMTNYRDTSNFAG